MTMNTYDATELSYKNGYKKGYEDGKRDSVKVVHCKDCIHMKVKFNARFCEVWCMINGMGDDGFCNYGERGAE